MLIYPETFGCPSGSQAALLSDRLTPPGYNPLDHTQVTILNPRAADAYTREHMFEWRRRSKIELCKLPWTAASVLIYRTEITDEVDSQGDEIWRLQVIAGERRHDPLAGFLALPGGKSTSITWHDLRRHIDKILSYYFLNPHYQDLAEKALQPTQRISTDRSHLIEPVYLTAQRELLEETGIHIPFIDFVKAPVCVYFYKKHTLLLFVINSSVDYLSNPEPMQTESDLADPRWIDAIYFIPRTGSKWLDYTMRDHFVPSLAQMINYLIGFFDTTVPHHYFNI